MRQFLASDIATRDAWLDARGVSRPMVKPPLGFIVDGVACGFLVQTDSDFALIDDVATNPTASATDRHAALESILDALTQAAVDLRIPFCVINAYNPSIVDRCLSRGMREHVGMRHFVRKV